MHLDALGLKIPGQFELSLDILKILEVNRYGALVRRRDPQHNVLAHLHAADLKTGAPLNRTLVFQGLDEHQLVAILIRAAGRFDVEILDAQPAFLVGRRDDITIEIQLFPELDDFLRRGLERLVQVLVGRLIHLDGALRARQRFLQLPVFILEFAHLVFANSNASAYLLFADARHLTILRVTMPCVFKPNFPMLKSRR